MITDERISTFIHSLDTGNTPFLTELERYAKETNVPVIRPQMQSFLKVLLAMQQPKQILEVGTAIGFSALLMAEYGPEDCHITTIEKYEKRIPLARENFKKAGREDRITLLEGDATEILKELEGPYDLIFMDAAKGQYIHFLPDILKLMPEGGVLLSEMLCSRQIIGDDCVHAVVEGASGNEGNGSGDEERRRGCIAASGKNFGIQSGTETGQQIGKKDAVQGVGGKKISQPCQKSAYTGGG